MGRERLLAIKEKSRMLNTMRRQLESILEQLEICAGGNLPCPVLGKTPSGIDQKILLTMHLGSDFSI